MSEGHQHTGDPLPTKGKDFPHLDLCHVTRYHPE